MAEFSLLNEMLPCCLLGEPVNKNNILINDFSWGFIIDEIDLYTG